MRSAAAGRKAIFVPNSLAAPWRLDNLQSKAAGFAATLSTPGPSMPNLATLLKGEITRISRKEARAENLTLKKAAAQHRADIAALKRRLLELEKALRTLAKKGRRPPVDVDSAPEKDLRFSASGFASLRRRLGLSAAEAALLVGASDQSIYKWEDGKSKPRKKNLVAIADLRKLTKKSAAEMLANLINLT